MAFISVDLHGLSGFAVKDKPRLLDHRLPLRFEIDGLLTGKFPYLAPPFDLAAPELLDA